MHHRCSTQWVKPAPHTQIYLIIVCVALKMETAQLCSNYSAQLQAGLLTHLAEIHTTWPKHWIQIQCGNLIKCQYCVFNREQYPRVHFDACKYSTAHLSTLCLCDAVFHPKFSTPVTFFWHVTTSSTGIIARTKTKKQPRAIWHTAGNVNRAKS